ncbi:MAG: TRAP transporter small permease [Sulfurospirillaceae bacterium]|nr:TRAP transporter small permease [Sulfurospirillaceae bacterium]MCK9545264.1 TRAP transporter small permease [Sulfurospirillaceae bacterium]
MRKFFSILDYGIAALNKNIAVAGIALGVLLAFVNVVLRYGFNASLTWAGELTNYFFMASALFGAAYGFKKGIHISVTILLNLLPSYLGKAMLLLAHTISFIYLGVSAYFGYELVVLLMDFGEMSIDLNIPMWIPHLMLPLAFAGATYRVGEKIYEVAITHADEVLGKSEAELIRDSVEKG